ncbi:hypothetical protein GMES_2668 [Paraglaciecola mesophila KMM 241]|uniref:Uncharacterized protein n=1 Tax=Paraglaciecola mesophila KMM 241 TaxID=1128912 RepID=K6Z3L3_9ALTE|nr:hypothetical protein GMES_2668 [Paraglaciecola mesophila KMM 241]
MIGLRLQNKKVRLKIRADYMRFLGKSPTNREINLPRD